MSTFFKVDMHNGGPIIYNERLVQKLKQYQEARYNTKDQITLINSNRALDLIMGRYPEYIAAWDASGLDIAVRTVGIFGSPPFSIASIAYDIALLNLEICTLDDFIIALSSDQLMCEGKRKYILSVESLEYCDKNILQIDTLFDLGIRIAQLTYNYTNDIGGGCMDTYDPGLTPIGREFVHRMNERGMIIDLSHVGEITGLDVLKFSRIPPVCTHTFSKSICNHPRGKSDSFLRELSNSGGIIGITLNPALLLGRSSRMVGTLDDYLKHIDYVIDVVGENAVGIGTDWDGVMPDILTDKLTDEAELLGFRDNYQYQYRKEMQGYNSMADWKTLEQAIIKHYGKSVAIKILGQNFINYYQKWGIN